VTTRPPDGTTRVPAFVRAMPRRALSRLVGAAVRSPLPRGVLVPLLRAYSWAYGADLTEAATPVESYPTFLDFFVRRLREGARPQDPDPSVIGSPADGKVHATSLVVKGATIQAKGISYTVADLLASPEDAEEFEGATATIVYLAPGDYHRFHWPFDGRIDRVRHVPGDLWPVHPGALAGVPRLFVRNERLPCLGRTANGGRFAFVPVGALNVGSIRLAFHGVRTNRGASAHSIRTFSLDVRGRRGDELGWFEMGSAIVLLLSPEAGVLAPLDPGTRVRVGAPIGRLRA
jgi:phosphatidylserine decarboxylase